ncbi:hypothetical protein TVAG_127260 [Trichomonas vaginalis G3]|uniref:Uncharacterized protein n=1 Tax=Trichomonas vaginalis (strain ATCC PRA-98 / G3) TaxID=412133 RepID=A2E7Z3_TRIV3|nr:hypothetical protein TVAGG3_0213520 [Trichomonas vaginalis G3]EAY11219.1 hypothetical protein TVAG_127260 [Trichomonas vaginalis G3]KAI5551401.1 hypothetical protein TVAGG3_0213520 [Trichomonas vaginalis G3]|eukprot:XP_001323442.1 hypothetical protein [Trichomonas vaginalis G3]
MRGTKLGAIRNSAVESSSKCCLDEMLIKDLQNKQEKFVKDLGEFVKGGHYIEDLSNQNIAMSENLNQRTLKVLSFANSIVRFEDTLNEREGNALRLLAEPEMTYTNLKPMVEELEAANKIMESNHKTLPTEALRKELMELSTQVSKLEAENTIREMQIKFRNEKLQLQNRLEIKKEHNLIDVKVPQIKDLDYKTDFSEEAKRLEKIQEKIDQILALKQKNNDIRKKIEETNKQKEDLLQKYNEESLAKRQTIQKHLEEIKMYNNYNAQIDKLVGELHEATIDSISNSDDAFNAAKFKAYIDGAQEEISRVNIESERQNLVAEQEKLESAKNGNIRTEQDQQALEDEILALEAKIDESRAKIERMEAEIEKYQTILETESDN